MSDNKKYKVGLTVKEPWAANISYEELDFTLFRVEDGGDGCGYIALQGNINVRPGTDPTVWVKGSERGQSIYDYCIEYGLFEGTEQEFAQAWRDAVDAATAAALSASRVESEVSAAEELRVSAESNRVIAEQERVNAETQRNNAETQRNTAEGRRDGAETQRVNAESGRVSAESGRVEAENARVIEWGGLERDITTAVQQTDAATTRANTAAGVSEADHLIAVSDHNRAEADHNAQIDQSSRLSAIEGVIPSDATTQNKLITRLVDDLSNYYLKSETYTKDEVAALIGAIQQFHYEVYASTSAVTDPASNVLYLIGPTGTGSDKYEEYVYDSTKQNPWIKIGDTSIDLSGYATTQALNDGLATKQNVIDAQHKLDYSLIANSPIVTISESDYADLEDAGEVDPTKIYFIYEDEEEEPGL